MSQHDMNIENQGFPAFRSDLNNALAALASTSAGATAPSTTFAQQLWYDSTNNLLKMRNTDNDAWITLAYFDQTNDEWQVRSAVIQAVDSAGVVIKTDDGTTRLTISDDGSITTQGDFTVGGDLTFNQEASGSPYPEQQIKWSNDSTTTSAFYISQDSDRNGRVWHEQGLDIKFGTTNTERMRIDSNGNIGTGDLTEFTGWGSPYRMIQVADGAVLAGRTDAQEAELTVNAYYDSGFKRIASGVANRISINSGKFQFRTAGSGAADSAISFANPVEISSSGISFDSGSNHLDDYEEGTWSPGILGGTISGGTKHGSYVKIGNLVTVCLFFNNRTIASATGAAQITNLPFTVSSGNDFRASGVLAFNNGTTATAHQCFANDNSTYVVLYETTNTSASTASYANKSGVFISMTITYRTT